MAGVFVAFAVPALDDYGPDRDLARAEGDYGEHALQRVLTGEPRWTQFGARTPDPPVREPHPDFRAASPPYVVHGLAATLSAASCRLLWTEFAVLPAMTAHLLPGVLFMAGLLLTLIVFGTRRMGWLVGLGAAGAALLWPRLLNHALANIRDLPETALYTWSWLLVFLALLAPERAGAARRAARLRWVAFGLVFGLTLAQKVDAIVLVAQAGLLFALLDVRRARAGRALLPFPLAGLGVTLLVAPLAWFAVSPYSWDDTPVRLTAHLRWAVMLGTTAVSDEALTGLKHLGATTPPVILLLGLLGLFRRDVQGDLRLFLVVGTLFPIARTLLPGARVDDGMRHFLEFAPGLCWLAGLGLRTTVEIVGRIAGPLLAPVAKGAMVLALMVPGLLAHRASWPHGNVDHNAFVGGLGGAQRAGHTDAVDARAGSLWQGADWLSAHAPWGADVLVPLAEHVASAARPVRWRPDLDLLQRGGRQPEAPLLVLALRLDGEHVGVVERTREVGEVVYTHHIQGGLLFEIFRVDDEPAARELHALWTRLHERPSHRLDQLASPILARRPDLRRRFAESVALLEQIAEVRPLTGGPDPAEGQGRGTDAVSTPELRARAALTDVIDELAREAPAGSGDKIRALGDELLRQIGRDRPVDG